MKEIQIDSILKKAKNLKVITEESLAKKVLEIDLNADSSKNQDLLSRLIRSLDQYVNKEQTLIYVGFVGHYSSGKSSTINKLLGLNNTVDERDTGLNPTDKAITLLTEIRNSNALILMNREGGNVPVRTSLLHNELLNNLVIADTPGSGDPQVVNEMIQDFLPICDYIFYFISAANPVDQADLPLLKQKTEKLPFVPTIFIITRTDEFRINKLLPLDERNIDTPKKNIFIGQLISRIKELIKTDDIEISNFFFIDNQFDYGLTELKEQLNSWTADTDKQDIVKIHGYKVEYYKANLHSIYHYFDKTIDEKIKKSKEFLKTAQENILRFDKSIELNNEKLRLLWSKSDFVLKQSLTEEKKSIDDIITNTFHSNLLYDKDIQMAKKVILQNLENQASGHFGRIVLDLNNHFKQKIRERKYYILENINKGDLLMEDISYLFPGRLDLEVSNQTLDIDFAKINEHAKFYLDTVNKILTDTKSSFKGKLYLFKTQISKELIINSVIQLYSQGAANIIENFDQYFERIQMYRSTVLTRNTKETIEKLRIGTQLDELDDEFSDDFMTEMKTSAIAEVYFSNNSDISDLRKFGEKCNAEIQDLKNDVDKVTISNDLTHQHLSKEKIDISQLISSIITKGEEVVNMDYQKHLHDVLDKHRSNFKSYLISVSEIRKRKRKSIIKWTLLAGAAFIVVYLGLRFSKILNPSTVTSDIGIGLACTVIGNISGWLLGMFKTDVKKITALSKEQFVKKGRSELLQLFGEDFWDELAKKITEPRTDIDYTLLKTIFNEKCDPILSEMTTRKQLILDELFTINKKMVSVISNYMTKIELVYNKHSLIFQEPDRNIEKIGRITKHIKETAIKPSFDLLKETTENLENVKLKIEGI